MNFSRSYHSFGGLTPEKTSRPQTGLRAALIISALLHLAFLALIAQRHPQTFPQVLEVELTSLPEVAINPRKQQTQIVTPPEVAESLPPKEETAYRSERDSSTPVEKIRRGDAPDAGLPGERAEPQPETGPAKNVQQPKSPPPPEEAKQEKEPIKERSPKSSAPKALPELKDNLPAKPLKNLALDSNTLLQKYAERAEPANKPATSQSAQYRAFSRPAGSGARFHGQSGSNDYLPNLPDGDITLLNAKADQFAVFVRRVATQVFGEIRNAGWEVLNASDIHQATRFSTFKAVLSPKGDLLRVEQLSGSGSTRFDGSIESAVRRGARDRNPPPKAAAADGNIHFIFQAKSWSQVMMGNGRGGVPVERRWLLLSTGLE
jgi:hypothetical protein